MAHEIKTCRRDRGRRRAEQVNWMDGWMMDGDARYDSEDLLLGNRHAGYGTGTELDGVGSEQKRYSH